MMFFSHSSDIVYSSSHAWSSASVYRWNVDSRAVGLPPQYPRGKAINQRNGLRGENDLSMRDDDRINPARTSMAYG